MISWEQCRRDFEWDGALRDIYIRGTTIEDWHCLYGVLRANYRLEYEVDGALQPIPEFVDIAIAARDNAAIRLRVVMGHAIIICHFFANDEIEFDLDPREFSSAEAFDDLLKFVQLVGDSLEKPVSVCHENDAERPFITYDPRNGQWEKARSDE